MVAPIPKTKATEILEQIGVFGRKDASELTIHRWKVIAKSLEASNIAESKRLQAIIAVYENNYEAAGKFFEAALQQNKNGMIYSDYGQALLMQGRGQESIYCLLKAYSLDPTYSILDKLLSASESLAYPDVLPEIRIITSKYNLTNDYNEMIDETSYRIYEVLEYLEELNVSVDTYRAIINTSEYSLFNKFYTQTKYASYKFDSFLNVIIYPECLSSSDISEINDFFIENLMTLDIPSDELMKVSVYFSGDIDLQEKADI